MHDFGVPDRPSRSPDDHRSAVDSSDGSPDITGVTVLIIDDDEGTRQTFKRLLRSEGVGAITSSTGKDGIEFAADFRFDLILIDLRLPDMSGTDLIAALRGVSAARLVLMSGFLTTRVV